MLLLSMRVSAIIGDEETYSIEHRVLNTVLVLGIIIIGIATVLNYLLNLTLMAIVSLMCGIIISILYYSSLVKRQYVFSLYAATFIIFIVTPILWMYNGGITGGTPFYIIIYSSMFAVAVSGSRRIIFVGCLATITITLMVMQYIKPELTIGYVNDIVRLDSSFGLLIAIIVNVALYASILNQYHKEHAKSKALFAQIEKQKIDIELNRLDRLSLIGEMAASIGHEIRNPLTTVRGFLQFFQSKNEYANNSDTFNLLIEELDRANSIITEFLALAKNKRIELNQTNLDEIILKISPLIQAVAAKEDKQLYMELNSKFEIMADENEIKQLVLNLANNAFEAIQKDGAVTIQTYQDENYGVLVIKDNGPGIPYDIYEKLGTPFMTTKASGTGLGLPICFSIVERHKAKMLVKTSSAGTDFIIRFNSINSV